MDVKLENVMISPKNEVTLIDFGLCTECCELSNRFHGSREYCAPEVLQKIQFSTKLADAWSIGILLFSLLKATFPFNMDVENQTELTANMNKIPDYRNLTIGASRFIYGALQTNPSKRWTIEKMISDPWLLRQTS